MIGRNVIRVWIGIILLSGMFLLGQEPWPTCSDQDGDGYGDPASASCPLPALDCNDSDPAVNPDATEVCDDTVDNDCDGLTDGADPDCATPGCTDGDGDGYGIDDGVCTPPFDCNDANPAVKPGATEVCDDTVDNDCDGLTDGADSDCGGGPSCTDGDGDGYGIDDGVCTPPFDCNDGNPAVKPGAPEVCDDTVDNNCNGLVDGSDPQCGAVVVPPPVRQVLGIPDSSFNNLAEADCRVCHEDPAITGDTSNVDRHHLRMGTTVPDPTAAPNGTPGQTFECLTCHTLIWNPVLMAYEFDDFRDCLACHAQIPGQASVHHLTASAQGRDCVKCHGGFVNNFDDGHYIPTYNPSLVTPWPSGKQPNGGPNGEGNCNFCHDTGIDPDSGLLVLTNGQTHHSTGLALDGAKCAWCHDAFPTNALSIRRCEECHGLGTLHNIQVDSDGDGMIKPGMELAYFGHIGNDDDCFGCHGFTSGASAPESGPVIPGVEGMSAYAMVAGTDKAVTITGSSFVNQVQNPFTGEYDITLDSDVRVTDAAGNVVTTIEPTSVTEDTIEVTLPGSLAVGNYRVAAVKGPKASNPIRLAVTPPVVIESVSCTGGMVAILGSGFGGYVDAVDSETGVTAIIGGVRESGTVISWTDTQIVAEFSACGDTVEVKSVFGTAATTSF